MLILALSAVACMCAVLTILSSGPYSNRVQQQPSTSTAGSSERSRGGSGQPNWR